MDGPSPIRPADTRVDERFHFVRRIEVRFRDLDALGHVNHVVYLSYVEQARTVWFTQVLGLTIPANWVIARVACDYALPLAFAEIVDVGWRLTRLGRASADYEFVVMRGADMVARGDVGIRSGRGFYDWRNRDGAATQRTASERLQRLLAYLEKDAAE